MMINSGGCGNSGERLVTQMHPFHNATAQVSIVSNSRQNVPTSANV